VLLTTKFKAISRGSEEAKDGSTEMVESEAFMAGWLKISRDVRNRTSIHKRSTTMFSCA